MNNEFCDSESFKAYANGLGEDGKPFGCPRLKVLPKGAIVKESDYPESSSAEYKKGSLICSEKIGNLGKYSVWSYQCSFNPKGVTVNKNGEIEARCGYNGSKFVLEVKGFEPA